MTLRAHPTLTSRTRCLMAAGAMAGLLAGCVANGAQAPSSRLVAGEYDVSAGGSAFWGEVRPGAPGMELTAGGARPVSGHEIIIRSYAGFSAIGADRGGMAKEAARKACLAAGGRFNETAIGAYERETGRWHFRGGCA